MPLQCEHTRDLLRRGRARVPSDEIEREVVPARRGARAHELFASPRDDEHALGMDRHVRIERREHARVAEVDGGVLAVEQARLREQEDARARGAHHRPPRVHTLEPRDEPRVAPSSPPRRAEQERWDDDDVRRVDVVDVALYDERHTTRERHRADRLADDLDAERCPRDRTRETRERGAVHDVVEAGEGGDDGVRYGDEADVTRCGSDEACLGHGASELES